MKVIRSEDNDHEEPVTSNPKQLLPSEKITTPNRKMGIEHFQTLSSYPCQMEITMLTRFEIAPITPAFAYGDIAPTILADLGDRYERETGLQVKHWAIWILPSGAAVPVPTQIDPTIIPVVRLCKLFGQTLQQVSLVGSHSLADADRFMISTAITQLNDVHTLQVA